MQIQRKGAKRDEGWSSTKVTFEEGSIHYDNNRQAIYLVGFSVPDFSTNSRHDWVISLDITEFGAILETIANALENNESKIIATQLAPHLTSLLRLATECSTHLSLSTNENLE